jgi:ParB/RepB/Spo0J family partition protein
MRIQQVKIIELRPAEYNPRAMSEAEMAKLMKSIMQFGFVDPAIVNQYPGRENVIVGGHQRVEAAKKLGYEEVPVVYVNLDLNKEKLLNLALNRIQGSWDEEKLRTLLF